jgi:ABC-2 type transport system ATP-binding protein
VLPQAGLSDRGGDRVATYSMGMKQRLGVAAALLKDPELLILDEPTNGLDPAGMAEMRDFIRSLAAGGRTVLLSSHLMGEIEQVSDRVGVIRAGELVAEGTVDELRGQAGLRVRAEPLDAAARVLGGLDGIELVDGAIDERAAQVNRMLVEAGIAVSELGRRQASLEDVFLELTGDDR